MTAPRTTVADLIDEREALTIELPKLRAKAATAKTQLQPAHLGRIYNPGAREAIEADATAAVAAAETAEARLAALPQVIHAARREEQRAARDAAPAAPNVDPPQLVMLARQAARALTALADALERATPTGEL